MHTPEDSARADAGRPPLKCADVQAVLFDYMGRELGESRSALVREHLRRCPGCQREAAQIREALEALQAVRRAAPAEPERLSPARRRRIARALMHPVLEWVYVHHAAVSVIVALLAALLGLALLRRALQGEPAADPGPTVTIGAGPRAPGGAPAPPEGR